MNNKHDMMENIFEKINEIYETVNIYKALLVYDLPPDEWDNLKVLLESKDFPLGSSGRLFYFHWQDNIENIDWGVISVVMCIGEQAQQKIRAIEYPNYILTINI